jgi:hypothetical protein
MKLPLLLVGCAVVCFASPAQAADAPLTRAEFTQALVQDVFPHDLSRDCRSDIAAELPARYSHYFADVTVSSPYAKEICLAMLFGLVDGNIDGRFRPNDYINVAEASKMITLAYGIALPDSTRIQHLGWHWRYTESLKRRGVLARDFEAYTNVVTADDMRAMAHALRTAKPKLLAHIEHTDIRSQPASSSGSQQIDSKQESALVMTETDQKRECTRTIANYHRKLCENTTKHGRKSQ